MTWGGSRGKFSKCSFHFSSLSSCLTINLVLEVLFFLFISFTFTHTNCDCVSTTEFLILSKCPWMYSNCTFWYMLVLPGLSQNYSVLAFLGFLLLSKDVFFILSHFSLIAIDSHGTLHLAVCVLYLRRLSESLPKWFCDQKIVLQKRRFLTVQSTIYPLLVYRYIVYLNFRVIWVGVGP